MGGVSPQDSCQVDVVQAGYAKGKEGPGFWAVCGAPLQQLQVQA